MLVEELFEQTLVDDITSALLPLGFTVTNKPLRPTEDDSENIVFIDCGEVNYTPKSMESKSEYWSELDLSIGILSRDKSVAYQASLDIHDSIIDIVNTDIRYKKIDLVKIKNSVEQGGKRSFYMRNMMLVLKYVEDYSNG